jgi:hypothetical protein
MDFARVLQGKHLVFKLPRVTLTGTCRNSMIYRESGGMSIFLWMAVGDRKRPNFGHVAQDC